MERFYKEILGYVINEYNIDLSIYDESYSKKRIDTWMQEHNLQSPESFFLECQKNSNYFSKFYFSYHNGYTEFFRYPLTYISFKKQLFESYITKTKSETLRIWCVGSSKGQEVYSIAMSIEDFNTKYNLNIDYQIFGTDISKSSLSYAQIGSYKLTELDNVTIKQLHKYFTKTKQHYQIKDSIKSHISFAYHDIVLNNKKYPSDSIYGNFDFIFLCNVAIYYNQDVQKDIINRLYQSVSSVGYIITSPAEGILLNNFTNIEEITQSTSIFRKINKE